MPAADAYQQVSEDKDKAFAWARASAVLEIGEKVRRGMLPVPLNLLQLGPILRGAWSFNSKLGLLVFSRDSVGAVPPL